LDVVGDAKRGGDMNAPGGREVAKGPEVHWVKDKVRLTGLTPSAEVR